MAGRRVIDIHSHPFGNPDFDAGDAIKSRRDVITLRRRAREIFDSRYVNVQDLTGLLVEDMKAAGIEKTFIQPGYSESPELIAAAVARHPDYLIGLFNIGHHDPKHPGDSDIFQPIDWQRTREEIDHYVKRLGLVGCGEVIPTRFTRESAPEAIARDLDPLFKILAEHKCPVMFATAWTQFATPLYHGMPLFVDLLAERYPEVPVIITKMGRGYSFIFEMALAVAFKHPKVYLDIVHSPSEHIERAVAEVGADRIMFGTDWSPTWRAQTGDLYGKSLEKVQALRVSAQAKEQILWRTAASLFGLEQPADQKLRA